MAEMANMNATIALIAIVSLALLFGCAGSGVPQEKYDALAASCAKAKNESASALSSQIAKTSAANSQLSSCTEEKQSLEGLLSVNEQEIESLKVDAAVLASARAKTDAIAQYGLASQYYLDAFGPGKVPNTARMKKIEEEVASLNDTGLMSIWLEVKMCQSITDCDNAKAKFVPYADSQIAKLAVDAAAIVGAGG